MDLKQRLCLMNTEAITSYERNDRLHAITTLLGTIRLLMDHSTVSSKNRSTSTTTESDSSSSLSGVGVLSCQCASTPSLSENSTLSSGGERYQCLHPLTETSTSTPKDDDTQPSTLPPPNNCTTMQPIGQEMNVSETTARNHRKRKPYHDEYGVDENVCAGSIYDGLFRIPRSDAERQKLTLSDTAAIVTFNLAYMVHVKAIETGKMFAYEQALMFYEQAYLVLGHCNHHICYSDKMNSVSSNLMILMLSAALCTNIAHIQRLLLLNHGQQEQQSPRKCLKVNATKVPISTRSETGAPSCPIQTRTSAVCLSLRLNDLVTYMDQYIDHSGRMVRKDDLHFFHSVALHYNLTRTIQIAPAA